MRLHIPLGDGTTRVFELGMQVQTSVGLPIQFDPQILE